MPLEWLNKNGLEDGLIPAAKECPFLTECLHRTNNCPSEERGNIRIHHSFSCGAARFLSLLKERKISQ